MSKMGMEMEMSMPMMKGMGAPSPMAAAGAGAASGVTNTAVTTTQEHMKSDKGQVFVPQFHEYKRIVLQNYNN